MRQTSRLCSVVIAVSLAAFPFGSPSVLAENESNTAANAASVDALIALFQNEYALRDETGLNWKNLLTRHRDRLVDSGPPLAFAEELAEVLALIGDRGIVLTAEGRRLATAVSKGLRNYNTGYVDGQLASRQLRSSFVTTGQLPDGIAYIRVGTWRTEYGPDIAPIFPALEEFKQAPGLIIDIRPNPGGPPSRLAERFAGCFIDEPTTYARAVQLDATSETGLSAPVDMVFEPNPKQARYRGPVVVLMGEVNTGSAELFLLMMAQCDRCKLIGVPSDGSAGSPEAHQLPNGVGIQLATRKELLLDGTPLASRGVQPDVVVEVPWQKFRNEDPLFDEAWKILADEIGLTQVAELTTID